MLLTHLPAPTREYVGHNVKDLPPPSKAVQPVSSSRTPAPPAYGSQERLLFRPKRQDDYGDGGKLPLWGRLCLVFD